LGYTSYWTIHTPWTDNGWRRFTEDVKIILDEVSKTVPICNGYGEKETSPIINEHLVSFNGEEDDGHETFYVAKKDTGFAFCKTARNPYDIAVVACLTSLKQILGSDIEVSSDGDFDDWQEGVNLANDLLNLDMTFEEVVE
jgi:hypothetical protein